MVGFLQRLRRLLSDDPILADDALAETDLRTALDMAYQRQLARLREVRQLRVEADVAGHRLEVQIRRLSSACDELTRMAGDAIARGDEAGARAALQRKQSVAADLDELAGQRRALQEDADSIAHAEGALKSRAESFRSRRESITAEARTAQARARARALLSESQQDLTVLDGELAESHRAAAEAELEVLAESAGAPPTAGSPSRPDAPASYEQPPPAGAEPSRADQR